MIYMRKGSIMSILINWVVDNSRRDCVVNKWWWNYRKILREKETFDSSVWVSNCQNKLWKERFGMTSMLLCAKELEFTFENEQIQIQANYSEVFESTLEQLKKGWA